MSTLLLPSFQHHHPRGLAVLLESHTAPAAAAASASASVARSKPIAMPKSLGHSLSGDDLALRKAAGIIPFSPILAHFLLDHPCASSASSSSSKMCQASAAPAASAPAEPKSKEQSALQQEAQARIAPTIAPAQAPAPTIAPTQSAPTPLPAAPSLAPSTFSPLDSGASSAFTSPAASPEPSAPASPAKSKRTARRVTWTDATAGELLCKTMDFYRWDEPWRCSPSQTPPRIVSPVTEADKKRSTLEFDRSSLPASDKEMLGVLGAQCVKVESVTLRYPHVFVTVRVLNLAYEKSVFVRVSTDNWATHFDVPAEFLPSVDPSADRFYASTNVPSYCCSSLQFAVCYTCDSQAFWDNNNGKNYTVKVNKSPETMTYINAFADGVSPFVLSR